MNPLGIVGQSDSLQTGFQVCMYHDHGPLHCVVPLYWIILCLSTFRNECARMHDVDSYALFFRAVNERKNIDYIPKIL